MFYWRLSASYQSRINRKLTQVTRTLPYILGQGYLDKIQDAHSVTPAEYAELVHRLDAYRQAIGEVVYIYAYTLDEEGRVVEVVDSLPLNQRVGKSGFFTESQSATPTIVAMLQGTTNKRSVLAAGGDEFGDFFSYLEVYENKQGKRFVLGADIEVKQYRRRLQQLFLLSAAMAIVSMVSYIFLISRVHNVWQRRLLLPFLGLVTLVILYTVIRLERQKYWHDSFFMAARALPAILGDDYIARTSKPGGISSQEYADTLHLLSQFAQRIDITYVYALRKINDRVVLVIDRGLPTAAQGGLATSYWRVPSQILPLFDLPGQITLSYSDAYRSFYSLFFSEYDRHQNLIVFAAEQEQKRIWLQELLTLTLAVGAVGIYILGLRIWERYFGHVLAVLPAAEVRPIGQSLFCKTALISSSAIVIFIFSFYLYARLILYTNYEKLEKREIQADIDRLQQAIREESYYLASRYADWSAWDDAYQFVQDRNTNFQKSNLVPDSLVSLDLSLVMYLGLDQELIGGIARDESLLWQFRDYIHSHPELLVFKQTTARKSNVGLVEVGDSIFLLAIYPVVRSDLSGEPKGYFVIARAIDQAFINRIGRRQNLDLRVQNLKDAAVIKSLEPIIRELRETGKDVIVPKTKNFTYGYTVLRDIKDQPVALVRLVKKREISLTGRNVISTTLLVGFISFGLVILVTNLLILQRIVTRRLLALVDNLQEPKDDGFPHQLPVLGNDEIAYLARTFNQLLEANYRSNEKFRKIFRASPTGIMIVRAKDGTILDANPGIENLFGYSSEELIGKNIAELGGWCFGHDIGKFLVSQGKCDYLRNIEVEIKDRYGREIACRICVEVIEIGQEICLLYNIFDISDIQELNAAISRANSLLRAQQETSIEGILAVDEQGRIVSFNTRLCKMWHLKPAQLSGNKLIHELLNKIELTHGFREAIERAYDVEGGEYCDEIPLPDERVFDVRAQPINGIDKKYYGQIWYFRDITPLVEIENKLREQYKKLEIANAEIAKLNQQLMAENLRMGAELDVARRLQERLLPHPTDLHKLLGVDVVAFMQPAEEVGGDYYDVFCSDRAVYIAIG
ncbi:MAG: CHASE4 domain-containing protein, partial [Pseudanabaenaceae cyanobacterium]